MSLKVAVKNTLKKAFFRLGVDISQLEGSNSDRALTFKLLKMSGSTTVLDVGANAGQFSQQLLMLQPDVRIISFEPLSSAHGTLLRNSQNAKNWTIADRMALGAASAKTKINIAGNSASSSLREMNKNHSSAAPESRYVGAEDVDVKRLDEVYANYGGSQEKIYLKIDTQGYEAEVLAGSTMILPQVVALQTEGSLVELYAGQRLAFDLVRDIEALGFKLFAIANGFSDPHSGQLLQVDLYFIRSR